MKFFKRLFCKHLWTRLASEIDPKLNDYAPTRVGMRVYPFLLSDRYWGCKKCGKEKDFPWDFQPLNFEETARL